MQTLLRPPNEGEEGQGGHGPTFSEIVILGPALPESRRDPCCFHGKFLSIFEQHTIYQRSNSMRIFYHLK